MTTAYAAAGNSVLKNGKGFTLLELIVVIVIMGVLLTIAGLSYQDLQRRSDVDRKVKQMYTDLMNTRLRAMQHGRDHFVTMATGTTMYRVYEDTFTAPDGNGQLDTASDTLLSTQGVAPFTLVLSTPTMTLVQFNSKGLVAGTQTGWIRINTTANGEYDCIVIDQIKTGMGKMNGANCIVK
jgi:prepilin-type N-terminal cleavage/methylation domain-containing protein